MGTLQQPAELEPGDGRLIQSNHKIRVTVMPNHGQVPSDDPNIATFWQAIKFSWRNLWNHDQRSDPDPVVGDQNHHDQNQVLPATPLLTWKEFNVHPQVTPARTFWFLLGLISFHCALVSLFEYYTTTNAGSTSHVVCVTVRWMLEIAHTLVALALFFTGFCNMNACERFTHHFLIKSVKDFLLMLGLCFQIRKIGIVHVLSPIGSPSSLPSFEASDHAVLRPQFPSMALSILTSQLLTVDALSIINLLKPGHHYYIFEVCMTLTMHLTLELLMNYGPLYYLGVFSLLFSFIIIVIKNFLWRNIEVNGQARPVNQQRQTESIDHPANLRVPRDVP